jgi:hypothetical protein
VNDVPDEASVVVVKIVAEAPDHCVGLLFSFESQFIILYFVWCVSAWVLSSKAALKASFRWLATTRNSLGHNPITTRAQLRHFWTQNPNLRWLSFPPSASSRVAKQSCGQSFLINFWNLHEVIQWFSPFTSSFYWWSSADNYVSRLLSFSLPQALRPPRPLLTSPFYRPVWPLMTCWPAVGRNSLSFLQRGQHWIQRCRNFTLKTRSWATWLTSSSSWRNFSPRNRRFFRQWESSWSWPFTCKIRLDL